MRVFVLLFKLVFLLRKKIEVWKISYLKKELKVLFSDRVILPKSFFVTQIPSLYFDNSHSKLVLNENISIRGKVTFLFLQDGIIEIGHDTFFNNNCSLNCFEKILIGNNCLFGENVKIYDHNHNFKSPHILIKNQGYTVKSVKIGNDCWVGSDVIILKGVTIGDKVVIGAKCIIHTDIPSNSLVINKTTDQIIQFI